MFCQIKLENRFLVKTDASGAEVRENYLSGGKAVAQNVILWLRKQGNPSSLKYLNLIGITDIFK